jgi:hypothetical protein
MAQVDCTITDAEYNQMMTVLNAMRTKLAGLKVPLTRMLSSSENGKAKVKAFAQTDDGRFLREVSRVRNDLNDYFDTIGWDR